MSIFNKLVAWIKSFFAKKDAVNVSKIEIPKSEEVKKEEPTIVEQKDPVLDKPTKIAIVVGHSEKSQGAVNYKGETEFSFNSRIAEKIKEHISEKYPKKKVKIFYRPAGSYTVAVKQVGKDVGKWSAKISMELHFNSFKKEAYGCEILMWGNSEYAKETISVSDKITDNLSKEFNLKERYFHKYSDGSFGDGVKILGGREKGATNIKACNDAGVKIAMLIEPCFANIEHGESKAIFENEDKYAEFLADELSHIKV